MDFPEDLKYTEDHEWVRLNGDTATIGITEFAQSELGDIVYVDVPDASATVAKGETFGSIEAVKTVSDLFMPLSGKIQELNPKLDESPETVNSDPYGEGWMIKIKISDPNEAKELLSAADYKKLTGA